MSGARALPARKPEDRVIKDMARVVKGRRRIDGADWYDGETVAQTIGMAQNEMLRRVLGKHRRTVTIEYGRYQNARRTYIDRAGIEGLVIARGGLCRARVMEALDAQVHAAEA